MCWGSANQLWSHFRKISINLMHQICFPCFQNAGIHLIPRVTIRTLEMSWRTYLFKIGCIFKKVIIIMTESTSKEHGPSGPEQLTYHMSCYYIYVYIYHSLLLYPCIGHRKPNRDLYSKWIMGYGKTPSSSRQWVQEDVFIFSIFDYFGEVD